MLYQNMEFHYSSEEFREIASKNSGRHAHLLATTIGVGVGILIRHRLPTSPSGLRRTGRNRDRKKSGFSEKRLIPIPTPIPMKEKKEKEC